MGYLVCLEALQGCRRFESLQEVSPLWKSDLLSEKVALVPLQDKEKTETPDLLDICVQMMIWKVKFVNFLCKNCGRHQDHRNRSLK